jgi:glutathione peroxidase
MVKLIGVILMVFFASQAISRDYKVPDFSFNSIDGGKIEFKDFAGKVVLVTNTASKCGFTGQYEGLQKLYEKYERDGLVVLGIPSKDFRQEYSEDQEVKKFCEVNFGITFPMSEITSVIGKDAHPFYKWLAEDFNFKPRWNFNKILIGKTGKIINTFGATVKPTSPRIEEAIIASLKK